MSNCVETEDWKLSCFLEWRPKSKVVDCTSCGGTGVVGGHFKDLDGERICPKCYGTKIDTIAPPEITKPVIPADLREHMRTAWLEFVNRADNKEPHNE